MAGKSIGGSVINDPAHRLDREAALRIWTSGSTWFSGEDDVKGDLSPGKFADLTVLSDDYFGVDEEAIRSIESVLTLVDGKVVHASEEFSVYNPELPPVSPDWSPVAHHGGYQNDHKTKNNPTGDHPGHAAVHHHDHVPILGADGRAWQTGCSCNI